MAKKSLYDISWITDEPSYRADPALSYSTLAKYERSGFNNIDHLFESIETPSLTFGSAVDSIITGGTEEFNSRFFVSKFPSLSPTFYNIVKRLFQSYSNKYDKLEDIPNNEIISTTEALDFYTHWKPQTRVKAIIEQGSEFYRLLYLAKDKTVIDTKTYQDVLNTVEALRNSESTKWYFQKDNPFEDTERLYQLKFKETLNGVDYKCMADLIIAQHDKKVIIPVDLKTSSKPEWDFYKSFIEWRYDIQSRLYFRIIKAAIEKDDYFKDFTLMPYKFIVVNKNTLTPLVWEFPLTDSIGTITIGKNNSLELRDPCTIGEELNYYLKYRPKVPNEISISGVNNLSNWLNKI